MNREIPEKFPYQSYVKFKNSRTHMEYMFSIDILGCMYRKKFEIISEFQPKLKMANYNLRYEKLLLCLRPDLS